MQVRHVKNIYWLIFAVALTVSIVFRSNSFTLWIGVITALLAFISIISGKPVLVKVLFLLFVIPYQLLAMIIGLFMVSPRKKILSNKDAEIVLSWIVSGKNAKGDKVHWTWEKICIEIKKEFGVDIDSSSLPRIMEKMFSDYNLEFSKITKEPNKSTAEQICFGVTTDNMVRLAKTSLPMDFVKEHKGKWNHQDWIKFCEDIEERGYTPINFVQVGQLLELKKEEYWAKKNSNINN